VEQAMAEPMAESMVEAMAESMMERPIDMMTKLAVEPATALPTTTMAPMAAGSPVEKHCFPLVLVRLSDARSARAQ